MAILRPIAFRRVLPITGPQKNRPPKIRRTRERFHQLESLEERVITAADVAANTIEVATSAIVGPLISSNAVQGERDVSADQQTVEEALSPAGVDEVMLDGEVDASHRLVVESVGDSAADGEAIDPQDFRASLDELLSQYQSETEQAEQEAQLQRQAVLGAAEHQAAQLLDDQQAQLQRAEARPELATQRLLNIKAVPPGN